MKDNPEEQELAEQVAEDTETVQNGRDLLKSIRESSMTKLEKAIRALSDPDVHALFRMILYVGVPLKNEHLDILKRTSMGQLESAQWLSDQTKGQWRKGITKIVQTTSSDEVSFNNKKTKTNKK